MAILPHAQLRSRAHLRAGSALQLVEFFAFKFVCRVTPGRVTACAPCTAAPCRSWCSVPAVHGYTHHLPRAVERSRFELNEFCNRAPAPGHKKRNRICLQPQHHDPAVAMPFWLTFVLFFVLLMALYICFLCFDARRRASSGIIRKENTICPGASVQAVP